MKFREGKEWVRFAALGAATAVKRIVNKDDSQRFLSDALAKMPGAPAKMAQLLGMRREEEISAPTPMTPSEVKALIEARSPRLASSITGLSTWCRNASLGQTHQAELSDGRLVAIKSQYPDIQSTLAAQIEVIFGVANFAPTRKYDFDMAGTKEFLGKKLLEETDYLQEAKTQQEFRSLIQNPLIVIPNVFFEFSSSTLLTQSWEESTPIGMVIKDWPSKDVEQAGHIWSEFFFDMLFGHGLIHTDLNPGNFGFRREDHQIKLVVYDFGSSYRLSESQKDMLAQWLISTRDHNLDAVLHSLVAIGFDRDKLTHIKDKLIPLSEVMWKPCTSLDPWLATEWRIQSEIDRTLGGDKWWFRTAGPPWFMYLMRTVQGWHTALCTLNVPVDLSSIWEPIRNQQDAAQSKSAANLPLMDLPAFKTPSEFHPIARTLKVRVTEGGEEIAMIEMPGRAVENLESLLPEHVVAQCKDRNINIKDILDRVKANGGIPQILLSASYGNRHCEVWLED